MNYWLFKSEPEEFSIDDLRKAAGRRDHWDGVRNYQARNFMRQMKKGDQGFFYHSNCAEPGIVGVVEIAREAYPDHTAFDPKDKHYDPKSTPDKPRWFMVDVKFVRRAGAYHFVGGTEKIRRNKSEGLRTRSARQSTFRDAGNKAALELYFEAREGLKRAKKLTKPR